MLPDGAPGVRAAVAAGRKQRQRGSRRPAAGRAATEISGRRAGHEGGIRVAFAIMAIHGRELKTHESFWIVANQRVGSAGRTRTRRDCPPAIWPTRKPRARSRADRTAGRTSCLRRGHPFPTRICRHAGELHGPAHARRAGCRRRPGRLPRRCGDSIPAIRTPTRPAT